MRDIEEDRTAREHFWDGWHAARKHYLEQPLQPRALTGREHVVLRDQRMSLAKLWASDPPEGDWRG